MSEGKVPLRLTGILRLNDRGAFLEVDDGLLWRLQAEGDIAAHQDRTVRIEA